MGAGETAEDRPGTVERSPQRPSNDDVSQIPYDFRGVTTPLRMERCGGRDQVVRQIEAQGWRSYEAPLPVVLSRLIARSASVFLDVGANTGYYSLVAALAGAAQVRAFEPIPFIADLFERNVAQTFPDGGSSIQLFRQAVAERAGQAEIFMPDQGHGLIETSASLNAGFRASHSDILTVPLTTLDRHLDEQPLPPGHRLVIKIDVESCEEQVLAGARGTITNQRPLIVLEILPGADLDFYQRFLQEQGYAHHALLPPNQLTAMATIQANLRNRDHLLIPAELSVADLMDEPATPS